MIRPWLDGNNNRFEVRKLAHIARLKARIGWQNLRTEEFTDEGPFCVTGTDFENGKVNWNTSYHVSPERYEIDANIQLKKDDLLITKDGTIGKVAVVRDMPSKATLNSGVFLLRSQGEGVNTEFMKWIVQSKVFDDFVTYNSTGSTISHLYQNVFEQFRFPYPEPDAQEAIADFLDRETARIDQLNEKKQRLVALLRERSLSAIEKAVSADASLSKLGHHVRIQPGYAFASASFSTNDEDIRLLRGANVSPGRVRWDDVVYWPKDEMGGLDRFQLEVGDIVMGMDRPWISGGIRVAEITKRDVPALLLQRVCKIIPLKTLSKEFLQLLLSSKKFLGYFEPELTGVSVPHISGDQIAGFKFAYLQVALQDERARACNKVLKSNDTIIERAEHSISGLKEFRSALITAAVTGRIDVKTWGTQGQTDRRLDEIEEAMQA